MECLNDCVINTLAGGDHAYCECECHAGTLPAIPPSRERRPVPQAMDSDVEFRLVDKGLEAIYKSLEVPK